MIVVCCCCWFQTGNPLFAHDLGAYSLTKQNKAASSRDENHRILGLKMWFFLCYKVCEKMELRAR